MYYASLATCEGKHCLLSANFTFNKSKLLFLKRVPLSRRHQPSTRRWQCQSHPDTAFAASVLFPKLYSWCSIVQCWNTLSRKKLLVVLQIYLHFQSLFGFPFGFPLLFLRIFVKVEGQSGARQLLRFLGWMKFKAAVTCQYLSELFPRKAVQKYATETCYSDLQWSTVCAHYALGPCQKFVVIVKLHRADLHQLFEPWQYNSKDTA